MKKLIVIYFLILTTGCELTLTDGENNYRLGLNETVNETDGSDLSSNDDHSIFEEMNLELIKIFHYEPFEIVISKISDTGEITEQLGSFEVIDGKVLLPNFIELKGFYHFELILEDENIQIVVPEFRPLRKHEKSNHHQFGHNKKEPFSKYILGPKEKLISDEVFYLVRDLGYDLKPSFKFVHKQNGKNGRSSDMVPHDENFPDKSLDNEFLDNEFLNNEISDEEFFDEDSKFIDDSFNDEPNEYILEEYSRLNS